MRASNLPELTAQSQGHKEQGCLGLCLVSGLCTMVVLGSDDALEVQGLRHGCLPRAGQALHASPTMFPTRACAGLSPDLYYTEL